LVLEALANKTGIGVPNAQTLEFFENNHWENFTLLAWFNSITRIIASQSHWRGRLVLTARPMVM